MSEQTDVLDGLFELRKQIREELRQESQIKQEKINAIVAKYVKNELLSREEKDFLIENADCSLIMRILLEGMP